VPTELLLCTAHHVILQAKIFRGKDISLLYSQLQLLFPHVSVVKPRSSRNSSIEAFVVCRQFLPPPTFRAEQLSALLDTAHGSTPECADAFATRVAVPFLACGDLKGWDSDMTYDLEEEEEGSGRAARLLEPLQPPIAAHYREAIARSQCGLR
jgi:tRNA (cytidine32/guanosine34-2'-O)-methyltransferase